MSHSTSYEMEKTEALGLELQGDTSLLFMTFRRESAEFIAQEL